MGKCCRKLEISGHTERRVPAMAHVFHAKLLSHPGDAPLFGDAADLCCIGLNDVEGAAGQPRCEALPAGEHFASGDGHGTLAPELTEIVDGIRLQRLFKPADIEGREHVGGVDCPAQAVRPIGIACTCIDEELAILPDRCAHRLDYGFVMIRYQYSAQVNSVDHEGAET